MSGGSGGARFPGRPRKPTNGRSTQGVPGTWVDLPEKALYVITAVAEFDGGYGLARAYRRGESALAAHEVSGKGIVARTWIAELEHGTRLDVMGLRRLGYEPVTLRAASTRLQVVGTSRPSGHTGL